MSSFGQVGSSSAPTGGSEEIPPSYTEYPTELPTTFPIGEHEVPPLINVTDLQAHLRLLGAFHRLKYIVQHPEGGPPPGMQQEHLWILFLNRAVKRFESFMSAIWPYDVVVASTEATMPPLDVLMVWHTYLLVWHPLLSKFCYLSSASRIHGRTTRMALGRSLGSAGIFVLFSLFSSSSSPCSLTLHKGDAYNLDRLSHRPSYAGPHAAIQ
jgi:hypothetical protein